MHWFNSSNRYYSPSFTPSLTRFCGRVFRWINFHDEAGWFVQYFFISLQTNCFLFFSGKELGGGIIVESIKK